MYAMNSTSDVYHLVTSTHDQTLCDLPVVPIVIDRAAFVSQLHLTSNKPDRKKVCQHCVRAKEHE